jgi:large subunit ribosomal protein L10
LSLNRNEKEAVIAEVAAQAGKSQTLALAEYRGLTVAQLDQLRKNARAQGVYLHVLKNTLARRAVAGTPFEVAAESMSGPLIYGFSEAAVAAAKVIADFAKGNDKLVILLAQLCGLLNSPVSGFARVLAAVAEQKGGVAAPAEEAPAA